jgi:hypothetical protein
MAERVKLFAGRDKFFGTRTAAGAFDRSIPDGWIGRSDDADKIWNLHGGLRWPRVVRL